MAGIGANNSILSVVTWGKQTTWETLSTHNYKGLWLTHWWCSRANSDLVQNVSVERELQPWERQAGVDVLWADVTPLTQVTVRTKIQGEPVIDNTLSPVGRAASYSVRYHMYASWLQNRHILHTENQCSTSWYYADRKNENADASWVQQTQEITSTGTTMHLQPQRSGECLLSN